MAKITIKMLISLLIIQLIFAVSNVTYSFSLSDIISAGDSFLKTGQQEADKNYKQGEKLKSTISDIYSVIFPLAVAITVIIGGVLGIKFMLASVESKAKIKEMLVPYVIGCMVIYGATGIWKLTVDTVGKFQTYKGYDSAGEVTDMAHGIIDGTQDVSTLNNSELYDLYSSQYIGDDLRNMTTSDPREQGKDKVYTLEEAIDKLSEYKRKIYEEVKKRGLLDSNEIDLK